MAKRPVLEVQNVNHPGQRRKVDAAMYEAMKRAYLAVLPARPPGLTTAEIQERLPARLPTTLYPGGAKAGWWSKTVQLDLEAKGIIAREKCSPIRLHRAPARSTASHVDVDHVLGWLERSGTKRGRDGMARYGIPSTRAFGVGVGATKAYAKRLGKDHALAQALWKSGWYEARLLASFVDEPQAVTAKQMDAWASDFDNWAVCDTVCFHLFDRTPLAWGKVHAWANARPEFKKRAAFALLWGLSVHDRPAADERFLECLPLIERAAVDERDYVKKGVDMALRATGKRNAALRAAAVDVARRLCESKNTTQAWIGRHAIKELTNSRARSVSRR